MDINQLAQTARSMRDQLVILVDEASVLRDAQTQINVLQRQEAALRATVANLEAKQATELQRLREIQDQLAAKADLLRQVEALIRG